MFMLRLKRKLINHTFWPKKHRNWREPR